MAQILLADDEDMTRIILKRAIQKEGHEMLVARNNTEASEILREKSIDILLIDLLMPGKGGIDLIYQFGQMHPKMPIIAISAAYEYIHVAEQIGVSRVIRKPFALQDVIQAIGEVVP